MKTRRVLFYIPSGTYGGAHNQVVQLGPWLRAAGVEPVILLPQEDGTASSRLEELKYEVYLGPLRRLRATTNVATHVEFLANYNRQVRWLEEFAVRTGVDVMQVHGLTCLDGAKAAAKQNLPLVWQLIDSRPPRALRAALAPIVVRSGAVVMTTGASLASLYGPVASYERRLAFFPPVDERRFCPNPVRRRIARTALGLESAPTVIGVGNLNPQKNFGDLIRAVGAVKRRSFPELELRIRGATPANHERYACGLKRLALQEGLSGDTVGDLHASGLDVADFMLAGDVFGLSSAPRSEGIPTAMLEAMGAGLRVVATRVGAVAEALGEERGVLVEAGRVDALASGIEHLLKESPAVRLARAESARAFVVAACSAAVCAETHLRAYDLALVS